MPFLGEKALAEDPENFRHQELVAEAKTTVSKHS